MLRAHSSPGTPPKQGVLAAEERRDPGSEDWPRDQRAPGLFLSPSRQLTRIPAPPETPGPGSTLEVPGGLKNLLWDCAGVVSGSKPGAGRLSLHTQGRLTQVTMPFHASVLSSAKWDSQYRSPALLCHALRTLPGARRAPAPGTTLTTAAIVPVSTIIKLPPHSLSHQRQRRRHHPRHRHRCGTTLCTQKWLTQWSTLIGLSNTNILCFCCSE